MIVDQSRAFTPDALREFTSQINQEDNALVEHLWPESLPLDLRDEIHIPVLKLRRSEPLTTLVYEIIAPFGFSAQQAAAVIGLLDSASGKYVLSATHRILRHRNWLIISPCGTAEAAIHVVEPGPERPMT